MAFTLPDLPYPASALEPHISKRALAYHHDLHHARCIAKLNEAVAGDSSLADLSLEELIATESEGVFNHAAQSFNHAFYWNSLSPDGGGEPSGPMATAIEASFGSFAAFKDEFTEALLGHVGSGWTWLVHDDSGLAIVATDDAGNPLTAAKRPILVCDVWEHAYYLDYRNARPRYITAWWRLVSWDFANANLERARQRSEARQSPLGTPLHRPCNNM